MSDQNKSTSLSSRTPQVFISHRHDDAEIADKLRDFIRAGTAGAVEVFQSSYAGSGPQIGAILTDTIGEELHQSEVVLLIFTVADKDWSYCMWETGVAFNPREKDTRIVVLQCGEDVPAPLSDRARVRVNDKDSVKSFVTQFLTDADFFPRLKRPVTQFSPDSEDVKAQADRLFDDLKSVVCVEPDEAWPVRPFIRFKMHLDKTDEVKQAVEAGQNAEAERILLEHCKISESDSYAPRLFGAPNFEEELSLGSLVSMWESRSKASDPQWAKSLLEQMKSASCWQLPTSNWAFMKHADSGSLYAPILLNLCKSPTKHQIMFDVYFVRFDIKEDIHRLRDFPVDG